MATKVVVDPITRIEGHLRIEAQVDNGRITDAWSVATMFRGIETIMQGRDPRDAWAFTQRICGVCTTVHAVASCRAVEDALDIRIPPVANIVRNLVLGMHTVHDHVMHFYHLHALDWVDVVSALKADPAGTARIARSISPWPNNSETYFAEVKDRVAKFVGTGQLGIFTNGYWGHPAYKLPPEVNLLAVAHYLEALDWQRHVVKLHTIFGGKNPHPNYLVGGMAASIDLDGYGAVNQVRLDQVATQIAAAQRFVEQVYWPDLMAIAGFYKEYAAIGGGCKDYLDYGEWPDGDIRDVDTLYFPRGIVLDRNLDKVWPLDQMKITEHVQSSWFDNPAGDGPLHPWKGESNPKYDGPAPPWEYLQGLRKYSWNKAPRYEGRVMEVGPLARILVAYAAGHKDVRAAAQEVLQRLEVGPAALFSTLGRTAARGIEALLVARRLSVWNDQLVARLKSGDTRVFDKSKWDPSTWPARAEGVGLAGVPRGALGHWVQIENGQIARYQCVVPSTWNASPRDPDGARGPYEQALMDNHPLADPKRPLELLRTIHSFDPCLACAVHLLDTEGNEIVEVKVQ